MNLKNLFRTLLVLLFFVGVASAQTFYVNNQSGNDANPGTSALPKLTVGSAIIAAPPGSTISVAYTGIDYTEGNITIAKALTFTSTGGNTPVFVNANLIVNVATTFTGPFQFIDLTLTAGAVTGASNLTFSGNITRTAGSVDTQIKYTAGTHNFTYNGGAAITSGYELPAASNTTNFGNLTTVGGLTALTLNESKTMNGILVAAGTLDIGAANTLTIKNASAFHTVAGNVTGGTLAFTMTGAVTVTGNVNLPNVTATKSTAGLAILTLTTNTSIGSLTAGGNSSITANNAITFGTITNNGAGAISATAAQTVGATSNTSTGSITLFSASALATTVASVSNSGAGFILLDNPNNINLTVTGNISQSSTGYVSVAPILGAGATVSVGGTVTNNPTLTLTNATVNAASNLGVIRFGDRPTTVTGLVTADATITGNASRFYAAGSNTIWANAGEITFGATTNALTLTGGVVVSSKSSAVVLVTDPLAASAIGTSITACGGVSFANTTGNILSAGGFSNSSNFANVTNITITTNGQIIAAGRLGGQIGTIGGGGIRTGAITCTSLATNGTGNGDIDFSAGTGAFYGVSVAQGAVGAGGDIKFGDHVFDVTGNVTSARTATGADITSVAATVVRAKVVGGYILNSGKSIIDINLASNSTLTVTGRVENSGTGTTSFTGASAGVINFGGVVVSDGTLTVPNTHSLAVNIAGAWTVSGGACNIRGTGVGTSVVNVSKTVSSPISWTAGNLDFTGKGTVTIGSVSTTLGGALTNPTFTSATSTLSFDEPLPNVLQHIYIGGANPVYPGPIAIINPANIPAPIVKFSPASGSVANLYVLNNVTFAAGVVLNSIDLDGVRVNVGKNGIGGGNGNFQNTTGYTTTNGGYVMMSGTSLAQTVNAAPVTAGAVFGNFGVDNEAGLVGAEVTFGALAPTSVFTGDFYLAEGDVDLTNTQFNGVAPWPTIYRTEGTFTTAPTLAAGTMVNVTYYGFDKVTALEVPAGATTLNNLTVSTTNGAYAGHGVVTLGAAGATVNGTLTVDADQNLYTAGNMLTLAGPTAILNGNLVDNGVLSVTLAAPTGTAFTGAGSIPSIQIADGSLGNELTLPGLVSQAFGVDNTINTIDDAFTTYDGNISYAGGVDGGSSLKVTFTQSAAANFASLTLAGADQDQTFTLGSNATMSGNVNLAAGTVDLGDFTLTHDGVLFNITGGSTLTSTAAGKLLFVNSVAATTELTVTAPAATIAANVEVKLATAPAFNFNALSTADLTITGNFSLVDGLGGGTTFRIGNGRILTLAGANVSVDALSNFTAGTGILVLDVAAPNTLLTYSTPANTNVQNLTVDDNVLLTSGGTLTVTGAFVHNAGDINIGSTNLSVGNGGAQTYTRTGGTYSGTGYFIWNATGAWNHGPAVAYPKLQVAQALNIGATGVVTVNDELYLNNAVLTQTTAGVSYLTIGNADGALVQVAGAGNISNVAGQIVPTFVGQTDYLFTGASSVPNTLTWPTAQATNVTVNAPAATVTVGANKTILGDVDLVDGIMRWDSPVGITLTDGKTITRRANTALLDRNYLANVTLGGFTVGNINLAYQNAVAVGHTITTDIEYSIPTVVNNISLLASTVVGGTTRLDIANGAGATAGYARTVAGTLSMASLLNINRPTVWTLAQTIPAGSTVTSNANTTWTGGLTVNGTYVNAAGVTSTGAITSAGTLTNNGTLNLTALTSTGATNLAGGSVVTMTGDATLNNLTVAVAPAVATVNTANNLVFTGTLTNAGLNVNFTGANAQTVALGGNRVINNLTLNKTANQTVTVSGGNITLQNAAAPNGVLTLTKGVLVLTDPATITLNPTVAGGFITALGYVRNPLLPSDLAHVMGRVGVAVPVNTIGRMEWPVGSATMYRPAAITFTAGNATIAPTTIIVSHYDATPTGVKNFPINGGVKTADPTKTLWIAGKAPYYWSFEATTSLGAAQSFNVELNGTNLQKPLDNHNDLRIIRRFDGDVNVNGWYMEGAGSSYSNAMYITDNTPPATDDTLLVVRNLGSVGSAISQKALFTIGLPSLKPVFIAAAPAAVAVDENTTYTFDFDAQDQDANPVGLVYALQGTVPANASIDATTGVFTFKPDYTQGSATPYNVTVRATKANDAASYVEYTFAITVNNVNRAPSFLANGVMPNASIKYGTTHPFTYAATDADGDNLTYAIVSVVPAPSVMPTITTVAGVGQFSFTPGFADRNQSFVVTVSVTDGAAVVNAAAATITVTNKYDRGDANTDAAVDIKDVVAILKHVVGTLTPDLTAEQLVYADCNTAAGDGQVGALDASYVKKYIANGNSWTGVTKVGATAGSVEFSRLSSENGTLSLPFAIASTKNVTSVYAEADLNNANIEVGNVAVRLPEGWSYATSIENGKVKIAAAGVEPISEGIFATVELTLKDKETAVSIVGNAILNDEVSSSLNAKVREIPSEFALSQNYPNPFNPTTTIKFSVAQDAKVNLVIYDMLGQRVRTLVDGQQEAGFYTIRWDGTNEYGSKVASGIYIYRLQAGNFVSTMKMNLMK